MTHKALELVQKHLAGKHPQKSHAGVKGGGAKQKTISKTKANKLLKQADIGFGLEDDLKMFDDLSNVYDMPEFTDRAKSAIDSVSGRVDFNVRGAAKRKLLKPGERKKVNKLIKSGPSAVASLQGEGGDRYKNKIELSKQLLPFLYTALSRR